MSSEQRSLLQRAATGARGGFRRYSGEVVAAFHAAAHGPPAIQTCSLRRRWARRLHKQPLGAMWLGHATMLASLGGKTILTDPVFSHRIGMSFNLRGLGLAHKLTFGLSRLADPALDAGDLPKIDLIMISHAHFDHLDRPSLERLARGAARGATVVTARNTARLIPRAGFGRVLELEWNASLRMDGLEIDAVRPAHWGARAAFDHHRKWNSYVVRAAGGGAGMGGGGGRSLFFAGDTALTDSFDRIGPVDLAMFGIGAYDPWCEAHATPEQVWRMFKGMGARHLAPMHHSTFRLGEEPMSEPMDRLTVAAGGESGRIVCAGLGDRWSLAG